MQVTWCCLSLVLGKGTEAEDLSMGLGSGLSTRLCKPAEALTFSTRISEPSAISREYEFVHELHKNIYFERELMLLVLQLPNTSHQDMDVSFLTLQLFCPCF